AGAVPCSKATGRWLFPKQALDRWVMAGLIAGAQFARAAPPPIVGGSHDPLLEWALRESGSGLAYLPEGSEAGLRRLVRGEVMAAAIHLHRIEGDDERANIGAVAATPGLHDAVVIAFARREQGLLVAPGNPKTLTDIASVAKAKARMAQRTDGAGAQLLLLSLLHRAGITRDSLNAISPACVTGAELAQAVRSGRADCGIASRAVARAAGVDFVPLGFEHFDLVMHQRDYFLPALQTLSAFLRQPHFATRAQEMSGYDVGRANQVRFSS
ncbi:MAG: substrate-binding domain-containing protein, partial [Pseudorhodoplanes sp.]|nr:substrate-binding domain-containing protein [Pseudorhodoplanes sp.]